MADNNGSLNRDLIGSVMSIFKKVKLEIASRPIVIKFVASRRVKLIFSKMTEINKPNLASANDHTKEEREAGRKLIDIFRNLKERGLNVMLIRNEI